VHADEMLAPNQIVQLHPVPTQAAAQSPFAVSTGRSPGHEPTEALAALDDPSLGEQLHRAVDRGNRHVVQIGQLSSAWQLGSVRVTRTGLMAFVCAMHSRWSYAVRPPCTAVASSSAPTIRSGRCLR
jgi:hypothetical protein